MNLRRIKTMACLLVGMAVAGSAQTAEPPSGQMAKTHTLDRSRFEAVSLRDQDGREVQFPEQLFGERLVAINFVFTRCGTICPPMGAAFGRLQAELSARPDLRVDLISISLDPVQDTPERLKSWAARFGRKAGWTLLTGEKPDVDRVLKSLDAFAAEKSQHAALVLLGDPQTNRWLRIDGLAAPQELLSALAQLVPPTAGQLAATR